MTDPADVELHRMIDDYQQQHPDTLIHHTLRVWTLDQLAAYWPWQPRHPAGYVAAWVGTVLAYVVLALVVLWWVTS